MVAAWLLLKEHLNEPFRTSAKWSHADVTEWARDDPKTPKRSSKDNSYPKLIIAEVKKDDEHGGVPGEIRVIINDGFSFDVQASRHLSA